MREQNDIETTGKKPLIAMKGDAGRESERST